LRGRFFASPDIYGHQNREPEQSINFVTCHDGFTLNDLVSYGRKHNEANREGNRDGSDHNLSWNCGVEGPSDDPGVENLRRRQIKNFLTVNLLSLGAPMILMGDEVRRTQSGNNNAYCQDNEVSWFDWSLVEQNQDIHEFVRRLISFRLSLDTVRLDHGMTLEELLKNAKIEWHGTKAGHPDWSDSSHSLAFTAQNLSLTLQFYIVFNAYKEDLKFEIPQPHKCPDCSWKRLIDTSLESPLDICMLKEAPLVDGKQYLVPARSVVLLTAELPGKRELTHKRLRKDRS
jgi:glycogen operon protein